MRITSKERPFILWIVLLLHGIYAAALYLNVPMNSDFANQILEAQSILSGNIFLSGWNMTGITFFTTELPFYTLGCALFGTSTYAYIFTASLMYLCLCLAGWLLASSNSKPDLTEFALFLLIAGMPTETYLGLLRGHCGVFIYMLLALYFVDRYQQNTEKKSFLWLFVLISILACCGDILYAVILLLPLVLICLISLLRNQAWIERKAAVALTLASGIGAALGIGLEKLVLLAGGMNKNSFLVRQHFSDLSIISSKFGLVLDSLLKLFKADISSQALFTIYTPALLIGCVILLIAIGLSMRCIIRSFKGEAADLISLVLSLSMLLITLILFFTDIYADESCARYFAYLPTAAAVLIVRQYHLSSLKTSQIADKRTPFGKALFVILAAALICCIRPLLHSRVVTRQDQLAQVLQDNDLEHGFAEFWYASATTVASKGQVKVRPIRVVAEVDGEPESLLMDNWAVRTDWYFPQYSDFIVFDGSGYFEEYEDFIEEQLGTPTEIIESAGFRILIYDYNIAEKVIIPFDAVDRPEDSPIG